MAAKAPLLRPASVTEPHKAQIEFEVTPGNTHAALRFYSVKGTQFYDAQTQKLVDAESKAIKLLPQYVKMTLIVLGLEGDVDYSATVRFRGLDDINWSPESPRSKPCRLVLASKMGPPLLVPEKEDEMKLICSMPPRAFSVAYQIYSHEGTVTTPHVVGVGVEIPSPPLSPPLTGYERVTAGRGQLPQTILVAARQTRPKTRASPTHEPRRSRKMALFLQMPRRLHVTC